MRSRQDELVALIKELPESGKIGRGPDGKIVVPDPVVSKHKLELFDYGFGQWMLQAYADMKPALVFDRPADVPSDDLEVHELLRKALNPKCGESDRQAARSASKWLYEVAVAEARDQSTLEVLWRAHRGLRRAGGDDDAQWAEKIRDHIRQHWRGADVAEVDDGDLADARRWAARAARRHDTVASWLLGGGRPSGRALLPEIGRASCRERV